MLLLHPHGRRWTAAGRRAAAALGGALGEAVAPRPFAAGEQEAALAGSLPREAWALLPGPALAAFAEPPPAGRLVVLAREDPRWSLEDMPGRPLAALPAGTRVVVPTDLGARLLLRSRPGLAPVRAGSFPLPEETPVLAEGPLAGGGRAEPLPPAAFVPAPGTGIAALLAPGEEAPPPIRALEDGEARTVLAIERALVEGAGGLPPGAVLGALARRKAPVLFGLRAVLFPPEGPPRDLAADIPLADARAFSRAFGRHLRGNL